MSNHQFPTHIRATQGLAAGQLLAVLMCMIRSNLLAILAVSIWITACGESAPDTSEFHTDNSSTSTPPPTPEAPHTPTVPTTNNPPPPTPNAFFATISGNWHLPCTYYPGNNSYYIYHLTLNGMGSIITTAEWFTGANCTNPNIVEVDSRVINSIVYNNGSWTVTHTRTAYSIRPVNQDVANYYNSTASCGLTNWAGGVDNNALGSSCGPSGARAAAKAARRLPTRDHLERQAPDGPLDEGRRLRSRVPALRSRRWRE